MKPIDKKYRFIIGVDTGVNTGYAVWDRSQRKYLTIKSLKIHSLIITLFLLITDKGYKDKFYVLAEDARKRKWFGDNSQAKLIGAGSIRRDGSILEDFLTDYAIPHEMIAPRKGMTKWNDEYFKKMTGWNERTNSHSRDAACLIYGI
jgi:hypothetical protein